MLQSTPARFIGFLLSFGASACHSYVAPVTALVIAPPPPPAKEPPVLALSPPPVEPNLGHVAIDALPLPATVTEELASENTFVQGPLWYGASAHSSRTKPICVTPCVVNLPFGSHVLGFSAFDPATRIHYSGALTLVVGEKPTVARIALGRSDPAPDDSARRDVASDREVYSLFGGTSALLGGCLLLPGLMIQGDEEAEGASTGLIVTGILGLAAGVALIAVGFKKPMPPAPPRHVRQDSTSVQWEPADGVVFRRAGPEQPTTR